MARQYIRKSILSFSALFFCFSAFSQQAMQLTTFLYLCPTCDTMAAHIKADWVNAADTNEFINLSGYVQKVRKLNATTKKYTTTLYNSYQVDTSQDSDARLYPRLKNYKGYSLLVSYYVKNNFVRHDYWALKRFTKDTLFLGKDGKDIYIRRSMLANSQTQTKTVPTHAEWLGTIEGAMYMDSLRHAKNPLVAPVWYASLMQGIWADSEGELIFHMHIFNNMMERYLTTTSPTLEPGPPDTATFTISQTQCPYKPDNNSGIGYSIHTMSNNKYYTDNCYLILSFTNDRLSLYYGDSVPTRHDVRRYYVYKRVK